jgi:hypothetical protein
MRYPTTVKCPNAAPHPLLGRRPTLEVDEVNESVHQQELDGYEQQRVQLAHVRRQQHDLLGGATLAGKTTAPAAMRNSSWP